MTFLLFLASLALLRHLVKDIGREVPGQYIPSDIWKKVDAAPLLRRSPLPTCWPSEKPWVALVKWLILNTLQIELQLREKVIGTTVRVSGRRMNGV